MSAVSGISDVHPSRARNLIILGEQFEWSILLVSLVTSACVGFLRGNGLSQFIQFLTTAIALFWLRIPLGVLLGSSTMRAHIAEERKIVWQATFIILLFVALPVYLLFRNGRNYGLLSIGAIAGTAFATQACVKLFGRKMRMPAQMIGAIGLTSTAAGAYYVVSGRLDSLAFALWAVNFCFACDQIHYVQLRLRNPMVAGHRNRFSRGWAFLVRVILMVVAVASLSLGSYLPLFAAIAFIPIVARGVVWVFQKPETLDVQWLGLTEMLYAITFGVLLIASFYVPR